MAASRRAAKKRQRTRNGKRRWVDPLPLLLQLEEPLRDVTNYLDALRLMGLGLITRPAATRSPRSPTRRATGSRR